MTHLEEGTIVAIRDGETVPVEAEEHLRSCVPCRTALDDARATNYGDMSDLFGVVDFLAPGDLVSAFDQMAPNDSILAGQGMLALGNAHSTAGQATTQYSSSAIAGDFLWTAIARRILVARNVPNRTQD